MTPPASPSDPALPSAEAGTLGPLGVLHTQPMPPGSAPKWKGDFEAPRLSPPVPLPVGGPVPVTSPATSESAFDHRGIPAWLVSAILHASILIALVLIDFDPGSRFSRSLLASMADDNEIIELQQLPSIAMASVSASIDDDDQDQLTPTATPPIPTTPSVAQLLSESEWGPESSLPTALLTGIDAGSARLVQVAKGGMHARRPESRSELGMKYGATQQSEDAVESALQWLAIHQQRDGSWSFDLEQEPCNGRCRHTAKPDNAARPATAATGLALLAFLGAGYTHHEGKYADEIRRGLYFLREQARPTHSGLDLQSGSMYGHGIATMAISEAMAMTRYLGKQDSDLFTLAKGGASFTMAAQHDLGGWRYIPGSPGDVTVSAWAVLSLISAQHGGVVLQTQTLSRAEHFLRSLTNEQDYAFKYQPTADKPGPTPTAIGLCLLLYLGQSPQPTHFARALDRIVAEGPTKNNVYHNYYATLALHHTRHRDWNAWHEPLRDHLVRTQATEGHEAGSWHFADLHGDIGGRLYTTAMAAMILEVYYRYLPLYRGDDEFRLD